VSTDHWVLGLSAYYHDSAACLLRNGQVIAAAQEERFSRLKHDHRFPVAAVKYCLREGGIGQEDLDAVAFYDKPWLKFERLLETYLNYAPLGLRSFMTSMPLWLNEKLWMGDSIRSQIGYGGQLYFPEHHQSHAASAFFPSPYDRAAILTLDGVGEWATASWGVGNSNRLALERELRFPHSLGLLYSAFTYYTGFRVNSGEYKVMGLAPYGEPKYVDRILDAVVDLREDGSFRLDMKYFNYCQGLTMTSAAFHELFGGDPREPESPLTQRDMDLARSVQEVAEEVMLRMARHLRARTDERYLCLAGGVALNCVGNGRILRSGLFDDIWIQPAAGDAGGALGAALFVWHQVLGNPRKVDGSGDLQQGSYLGPAFPPDRIATWLDRHEIAYYRPGPERVPELAARFIDEGKVVGWFSGRMEFGPRALGARSILGDARDRDMQSILNRKIKHRESFRPFAPSCLEEDAPEFFEIDRESPYMTLVARVREERRLAPSGARGVERAKLARSDIPAVTHVDYSARIQTVGTSSNPAFRRLLEAFKERTGYGVVINTSFNVRGEPIVCTPEDAYDCFMRTEMDVLVLEDCVIYKDEQRSRTTRDEPRMSSTDALREIDWPELGSVESRDSGRPRAELRKFGLVMAGATALLGGYFHWRGYAAAPWVAAVAGAFLLGAVTFPRLLGPIERFWLEVGGALGAVVSRVVLALAFYLVITPLGLAMRVIFRDTLGKRPNTTLNTYWVRVEPDGPATRPDRPF
jgi:carbamoyltransferase